MKSEEKKHYLNSILEIVSSTDQENRQLAESLIDSLGLKKEFINLLIHEIQSKKAKISFMTWNKKGKEDKSKIEKIKDSILNLQQFKINLINQ